MKIYFAKEKAVKKILFYLLQVGVVGIILFPCVGYIYLLVMLLAGIGAFVPLCSDLSMAVLSYGWKIYFVLVMFTFVVMTTFVFMKCCEDRKSFIGHLKHGNRRHLEVLKIAMLWPVLWAKVDQDRRSWGLPLFVIIIDVVHFWAVTSWRGTPVYRWPKE